MFFILYTCLVVGGLYVMSLSTRNMQLHSLRHSDLIRTAFVYIVCYFIAFQSMGQTLPSIVYEQRSTSFSTIDTSKITKLLTEGSNISKHAPDSAIIKFKKAFLLSNDIGYIDGAAKALLCIGHMYVAKRNYNEAIRFYNMAFPYCKYALFTKDLLTKYYIAISVPYDRLKNIDSTAYYLFAALNEADRIKDTTYLIQTYSNIGGFWINNKKTDKAIYYLRKGERIALLNGSYKWLPSLYTEIGMVYGLRKNWNQALQYAQHGVAWSIKEKNNPILSKAYGFLGVMYLEKENLDSAFYYYNKSLSIEGHKSSEVKMDIYINMGTAYGNHNNPLKALQYYIGALKMSDSLSVKDRASLWFNLAVTYNKLGQYKKAIQYFNLYTVQRDSLLSAERNISIDRLDVKYRTAEKDKELAISQLLLARQKSQLREKNIWIVSISCFVALLIVLLGLGYRNHYHRQRLQKEYIRNLEQEREINNLTSVMKGEEKERTRLARELHDGIMVQLSTVRMNLKSLPAPYKELQEMPYYKQTIDLLENVSKELRQTAHNLMPDMLLEGGISEAVFYFCKTIEQNTKINITFQQHDTLPRFNREFEMSIYRIVQELVQNIIKHAHASSAIVQLIYRHDVLFLTVTDDGIGFKIENLANDIAGMGLKSIRSRVSAMNGIMDIQTKKNEGTSIYLEFDLHNNIQG